jgi:hypothetical protein
VKAWGALAVAIPIACSRGQPEKHAVAPKAAAPVDAGPPSVSSQGADISWLVGTWERQSAPKDWLLFNAPKEAAVIAGNPPTVTGRGEFAPAGRSISIFIPGPGGGLVERVFEASADHAELREQGATPATYRRGAPP